MDLAGMLATLSLNYLSCQYDTAHRPHLLLNAACSAVPERLLSTNISCPWDTQQQTRRTPLPYCCQMMAEINKRHMLNRCIEPDLHTKQLSMPGLKITALKHVTQLTKL